MTAARLAYWHRRLAIPPDYGSEPALPRFEQARDLVDWGPDMFERPRQLQPAAAEALNALLAAARVQGQSLQLVSAYRSYDYQGQLIEKKLNRGETIDQVLKMNVAPGYSEHHTGCAVDLSSPGFEPLEEEFETSPAFAWLQHHAGRYQFVLSYPRNNRFGLVFEPWHWCFRP